MNEQPRLGDYDIRHYRTPRTISGFYVESDRGDRLVCRVAVIILLLLGAAIFWGYV